MRISPTPFSFSLVLAALAWVAWSGAVSAEERGTKHPVQLAGGTAVVTTTTSKTTTKTRSSGEILRSIKESAALIIVHYKTVKAKRKLTKGEVLLVKSANALLVKVGDLGEAIKQKKPKTLSVAMRDIYISYGRLLTTSQLLDVKDKTVDQAMRATTGSWTTYATHYAVGQRVGGPPSKAALARVKRTYGAVAARLASVHKRVAKNPRLARQVGRMAKAAAHYQKGGVNAKNFRAALRSSRCLLEPSAPKQTSPASTIQAFRRPSARRTSSTKISATGRNLSTIFTTSRTWTISMWTSTYLTMP